MVVCLGGVYDFEVGVGVFYGGDYGVVVDGCVLCVEGGLEV